MDGTDEEGWQDETKKGKSERGTQSDNYYHTMKTSQTDPVSPNF